MSDSKKQLLQALAYANDGQWAKAHETVQELSSKEAAWIHANLHREEGDEANARYWYHQAGRSFSTISIKEERRDIKKFILKI